MRIILAIALACLSLAQSAYAAPGPRGHSLERTSSQAFNEFGEPAGLIQSLKVAASKKPKKLHAKAGELTAKHKVIAEKGEELPGDPPIQFLTCPNEAEVKVLANEITYGAGGPQVPTRLSYELDGVVTAMFGGQNVTPGAMETIALQPEQELKFWGHSAYPNFEEPYPWVNYLVASDDAVNAAVLINGDNFFSISAAKGIQAPFGMQQSLQAILESQNLANAINWTTGLVTLESNEMIVLFELGASSPQSPAFDFNDLVLHVLTPCPIQQPYDLRNNIPGVQGANLRISAMESTTDNQDSNVAINFIGDGRAVNFLEVLFVTQSGSGVPNGFTPAVMDFKLTGRYSGTTSYAASPFTPTEPNDWQQVYDTPSNSNWLTPLYSSFGYSVYRAEFFFSTMVTIPGQEHSITWSGLGNIAAAGKVFLLFSNNSGGSFGAYSDWYYNNITGAQSFISGGAPFPTVAARVGFVPPP